MAAYDFEGHITDIPDYPEKGVVFKDITTLLKEPEGFHAAIDAIADHFKDAGVTKVVGAEARGFLIGAPVAYRLGAGFVPARKPGKLPREVRTESYELEYGTDELQMHVDALDEDDVVLIIDDLVASWRGWVFLWSWNSFIRARLSRKRPTWTCSRLYR